MLKIFQSPFWGRGFRPFFLLGSLYATISIFAWGGFYAGRVTLPVTMLDPVSWHAHEMIYGFSMAIVAGFLLTAVANWTGGAPARHIHLALLCLLWISGRLVMSFDLGLPFWTLMVLELAFIPALALTLAIPLLRSWNKRNFVFLTVLSVLFGCNLWFLMTLDLVALRVALMMILIMVSLIGGRVIPAFTVAALRRKGIDVYQTDQKSWDIAALASLVAVTICFVVGAGTVWMTLFSGLSALIHARRMWHYHTLKILDDPLVWILHVGYVWLVLGLILLSLTGLNILTIPAVIHALTAGCIGSMILGMICRVTLGHTGRELKIGGLTKLSFLAIQMAAITRVFGPLVLPAHATGLIVVSAMIWGACFLLYLGVFGRMLFQPRPDGQAA